MRVRDRVSAVLIAIAIGEAGLLAWRAREAPILALTIAVAAGQDVTAAIPASVATVGDWVTIEDLGRGALVLAKGDAIGAPALTESERAALKPLVTAAVADRAEMLRVEAELAAAQESLNTHALALAQTLTPEQRAWIVSRRSQISVGEVTAVYWAELTRILETP